jgi:effector-binding domain-containing protein
MITLTREEAQQVLKLLDTLDPFNAFLDVREPLRARLAEPEKEQEQPDAAGLFHNPIHELNGKARAAKTVRAQPEQEPVAWMCSNPELIRAGFKQFTDAKNSIWSIPVYAAPPQQQNQFNPDWDAMAVMVEEQQRMANRIEELEAKLKEKNT